MEYCNFKKKLEKKALCKDKTMKNLSDLEKKINSELTTKIKSSKIVHNQVFLTIDSEDLLEVILFLKNNNNMNFKQLIDITAVDYP